MEGLLSPSQRDFAVVAESQWRSRPDR